MKPIALFLSVLTFLNACGATSERYVVPTPQVTTKQRIAFSSVEIRDVSLPAYAADDEIVVRSPEGRLMSEGSTLWADTPDRAISLELSRYLSLITGARVASNPWPLESFPEARLDLRFDTLLAGDDGQYRASGQYFVAVADGRRERAGLFNLAVSFDPVAGPAAIAAARGQIVLDLAGFLASSALR